MKGIIFTENIDAIAARRKMQTRRVMKQQPIYDFCHEQDGEWFWTERNTDDDMMGWWPSYEKGLKPRHKVGDVVYVKEVWGKVGYSNTPQYIAYMADGRTLEEIRQEDIGFEWGNPMYMPQSAARIFLRIKAVRVERLQAITPKDLRAEGMRIIFLPDELKSQFNRLGAIYEANAAREQYREIWNNLNKKPGEKWEADPWVWVYEFELAADLMPADRQGLQGAAQPVLMPAT